MPEPEGDDGQIGARFQKVNRRGVPQGVRRDRFAFQRWASAACDCDGTIETVTDARTGQGCAGPVGEYRVFRSGPVTSKPAAQVAGGALPERDHTFFASLAVKQHRGAPVEQYVSYPQTGDLRNAGAGVVERGEHDGITVTVPGASVGCVQDRGDLCTGQVAQDGPIETLAGDGQHSLRDREGRGVADGRVAHKGVDRGQPGIAGADAVAALGFQVIEEVQHERSIQVGQP
ncbi:MAG TPA: hypothetical protein VIJ23_08035 [Mycobacterium sp.]